MNINEQVLRHSIPLVINSFNQPTYLKNILTKLKKTGFSNLYVLDQASSSTPLLELYEEIKAGAAVVLYAGGNFGPRYFYDARIFDFFGGGPVIYTDPDLDFDNLATNFVSRLLSLSNKYQQFKVGPALAIPEKEDETDAKWVVDGVAYSVSEWEQQFWSREIEQNVYSSIIDTTFHLFNPKFFVDGIYHHLGGLRVAGDGFTFKHLPWYKENGMSVDEFKFYKSSTKNGSWVHQDP